MTVKHATFDKLQLRVRELEYKVDAIASHLGLEIGEEERPAVSPEVMDLIYLGDLDGAVALFVDEAGMDIEAAKEVINDLGERI